MKRRGSLILVTAVLGLVATACPPEPQVDPGPTTTTTTTTTTSTSTSTTTAAPEPTGTVVGHITITGDSPNKRSGDVMACPGDLTVDATTAGSGLQLGSNTGCRVTGRGSHLGGAPSDGNYSVALPAGEWSIAAVIEPVYDMFTYGPTEKISVAVGTEITKDLTVAWVDPGGVSGSVHVTGGTPGAYRPDVYIAACPGTSMAGATPTTRCINGGSTTSSNPAGNTVGSPDATYVISPTWVGLLAGTWTLQASFGMSWAQTGAPRSLSAPVTVEIVSGQSIVQNFELTWPSYGTVGGSVTFTGRPEGGSTATQAYACPGTVTVTRDCPGRAVLQNPFSSTSYGLLLTPGTWSLAVASLTSNFNALPNFGPSVTVTVADGDNITQPLTAPWTA